MKSAILLISLIFSFFATEVFSATITVTNTNDSGAGSLRQAIADSNSDDTIVFSITGTITLTTGELSVNKNLTISGPGSDNLTISGNNTSRIFYINNVGATVTISNLTLTGGNSATSGGGIENEGTLTLDSCVIASCSANGGGDGYGGGIDNYNGNITIANCIIAGNTASTEGGGVCTYGGSITITDSYIQDNTSGNGGGLSNRSNGGGIVTISGSTISGNDATAGSNASGGGIFNSVGALSVTDSTISGNIAGSGYGGGIDNYNGNINITNCTIEGNIAINEGGGVCTYGGTVDIINSTIQANTSNNGGGLSNRDNAGGIVTIIGSTIGGNGVNVSGGGIFNSGGNLNVFNSTISSNYAVNGGGGIIDSAPATITIEQSTIAYNTSTIGGGGIQLGFSTANIKNSILAVNTGGSGNNFYNGSFGGLNSQGYNLCNGPLAAFAATGDQTNATLNIGPLTNNGGSTFTHKLLFGSDAIDAIPEGGNSYNGAPATDQRGVARPQGTNVDIGAYELQLVAPVVTTQPATSVSYTSATLGGNATSDGGAVITERGLVYSASDTTPTIGETGVTPVSDGSGTGTFSESIGSLSQGTTYYFQAYSTNSVGTSYGGVQSFTTLTPEADLVITKTDGVDSVIPGGSLTYTIVIGNIGPSADPAVSVTDTFPASLTCSWTSTTASGATGNTVAGAGNINETLLMPVGSSATYTVSCTIDSSATGVLSNTATVTASVTDPAPGNNAATDIDSLAPEANLVITKTDGADSVIPGGNLTYTIVIGNIGLSADPAVSVTDIFPASLSCAWTSLAAGGTTGNTMVGAGNINETLSMPAGSSATYTVSCTIDSSATGVISNTAIVAASVTDPAPGNNAATDIDTLTPQADLAITKTDSPDPVIAGNNLNYSLTVTNNGPSDAVDVVVTDTLPAGVTLTATAGCAEDPAGVPTCTLGSIASGNSAQYTISVSVDASASGVITNQATVTTSSTDPALANNTISEGTAILSLPSVITNAVSGVGEAYATLNGTVNANSADTTVTFEYGPDTNYGTTVTADQSPVTGNTDTPVSKSISGLTPNTTYHYRVVGTSAAGTANGNDMTFQTKDKFCWWLITPGLVSPNKVIDGR